MKARNRKLRILLVENSFVTVEQLTEIVQSGLSDLTVALTATEEAAIDQLRNAKPELVILDWNLKTGSGFNVLRASKEAKHPPVVVVLTEESVSDDAQRAIQMGADYVVDKCRDIETLSSIILSVAQRQEKSADTAFENKSEDADRDSPGLGDSPKPLH
jgi:DNA-binding NarL/FixJ family response regulator